MRLLAPGEPEGGILVDLLFAFSGMEGEVVAAAAELEVLPGLVSPVATTGHLLALKVFAAEERDKDLVDIPLLLAAAGERDLMEARKALDLIARRGMYEGERELGQALEDHIRKHSQRRRPLP